MLASADFAAIELDELVIPSRYKAGPYEVRFAQNEEEIAAAKRLRYNVFYVENEGKPTAEMQVFKQDMDEWDEHGFHIIVVDNRSDTLKVVGTLRLFYNLCLMPNQQFYTEQTFDLTKVKNHFGKSLELSRFCIDSTGRGGAILMLIWKYAMSFIQDNNIDVMFGCASFSGTDANTHAPILNYLYQNHLAPKSLRPSPKVGHYIDLNTLCKSGDESDWESAQKSIPTLLRGYLKLGAKISDAAIIDEAFNTIYLSIYVESTGMKDQNPNLVNHV